MGTRDDASLSAQERAALASLESTAAAADPQLAARLKGHSGLPLREMLARTPLWLRSAWTGAVLVVIGLALMLLSLSLTLAMGFAGAVLAATGLGFITRAALARWGPGHSEDQPTPDPN